MEYIMGSKQVEYIMDNLSEIGKVIQGYLTTSQEISDSFNQFIEFIQLNEEEIFVYSNIDRQELRKRIKVIKIAIKQSDESARDSRILISGLGRMKNIRDGIRDCDAEIEIKDFMKILRKFRKKWQGKHNEAIQSACEVVKITSLEQNKNGYHDG